MKFFFVLSLLCPFYLLFLFLCFLCSTSLVNVTGSYTEDEPLLSAYILHAWRTFPPGRLSQHICCTTLFPDGTEHYLPFQQRPARHKVVKVSRFCEELASGFHKEPNTGCFPSLFRPSEPGKLSNQLEVQRPWLNEVKK